MELKVTLVCSGVSTAFSRKYPTISGPVHNQLHQTGSYFLENENAHMAIFQLNYNYSHPKGSLGSFLTDVRVWVNSGQGVKGARK